MLLHGPVSLSDWDIDTIGDHRIVVLAATLLSVPFTVFVAPLRGEYQFLGAASRLTF